MPTGTIRPRRRASRAGAPAPLSAAIGPALAPSSSTCVAPAANHASARQQAVADGRRGVDRRRCTVVGARSQLCEPRRRLVEAGELDAADAAGRRMAAATSSRGGARKTSTGAARPEAGGEASTPAAARRARGERGATTKPARSASAATAARTPAQVAMPQVFTAGGEGWDGMGPAPRRGAAPRARRRRVAGSASRAGWCPTSAACRAGVGRARRRPRRVRIPLSATSVAPPAARRKRAAERRPGRPRACRGRGR